MRIEAGFSQGINRTGGWGGSRAVILSYCVIVCLRQFPPRSSNSPSPQTMNATDGSVSREKTVHVFVSYAREDKRWLDPEYRCNLIPFLAESLRRYDVVFWYDTELKPGDVFKRQIEAEIDQAQIALLIVSQSFLNSEFIEQIEMPRIAERARQGETIVIPVLVEPCDWSDYPFLADRQMVPSANPLIDFTESEAKWAKVKFQILDGLKAQLKRIREIPQSAAPARHIANEVSPAYAGIARPSAARSGERGTGGKRLGEEALKDDSAVPSSRMRIPVWAWSVGAASALVLLAVIVGLHFNSRPGPVGSPQTAPVPAQGEPSANGPSGMAPGQPATSPPAIPGAAANNAPALGDTMKTIRGELISIGTVNFTTFGQNKTDGSALQSAAVNQISDVVANASECRVSYHWKVWRNGAAQPTVDKDSWFLLHDVTSVVVEPLSLYSTDQNAAGGHPNLVVTSTTPSLTALVIHMPRWVNELPFKDSASADRTAKTVTQAVRLCGGHLAN